MKTIRIGTGQGYWGDRLDAPFALVDRGRVQYICFDYLAELTMSILQKQKERDPSRGYAHDFVTLCRQIISLGLSVHATEQLARQAAAPAPEPARDTTETKVEKTDHVLGIERELTGKLSLKVDIRLKSAEKGALVVAFDSTEEFERIVSLLRAG